MASRSTAALVGILHAHGFLAAIALLGVDGVRRGTRHRARLLSANAEVPLMVCAVGPASGLAAAGPELAELAPGSLATVERVQVCRTAGRELGPPSPPPASARGQVWQQLTVWTLETDPAPGWGEPIHGALVRALRRRGARGATALRGVWGHRDGAAPAGDRLWQLRRRVPVMTLVADAPERIAAHYAVATRLTARAGVITSEYLPAFRAAGPGVTLERLALSDLQG